MIYQGIRFIIILAVIIALCLINKKLKLFGLVINQITGKKKFHIFNKLGSLVAVVISIVIIVISIYPYEGYFLKFNSVEESFNYSVFLGDRWENYEVKGDHCSFMYSKQTNSNNVGYHSVYKNSDNTYSMLDFKCDSHNYKQAVIENSTGENNLVSCHSVYNKLADETCYFVEYWLPKDETNTYKVELNGKELDNLYYSKGAYGVYATVKSEGFADELDIIIEGTSVKLEY